MSAACQYETDVTDAQWDILHPLLPKHTWTPPASAAACGQWHVGPTGGNVRRDAIEGYEQFCTSPSGVSGHSYGSSNLL